jgi:leucyl-tRNA synthetase
MELLNVLSESRAALRGDAAGVRALRFAASQLCSLVQPFCPHVAEELWRLLGGERLWRRPWPEADERFLTRDSYTLVIQVGGKLRGREEVPADLAEDELVARARALPNVASHLEGRELVRVVVVPGRLVNFVVRPA